MRGVKKLCVAGAAVYYGVGPFSDLRGSFEEVQVGFPGWGEEGKWMEQSGFAQSHKNVVRGMHCSPYAKLVLCVTGEMFDAIVDLRPESPTFLKWDSVLLSPERRTRIYIPAGVAHGYMAMREGTMALYYKFGLYEASQEIAIHPMDPEIGVRWPSPLDGGVHILSAKDRGAPSAREGAARRAALAKSRL